MSLDVPASSLTTDELAKLSNFRRQLADDLDLAFGSSSGAGDIPVFNVKVYGALGDGFADDRSHIQAAIDAAAAAGGGVVYFPAGTYMVSRSGTSVFCLQLTGSNIKLWGVKGASWIKRIAGQPNATIYTLYANQVNNITLDGIGIDGNWGNAATTIANASGGATLPQATINVLDTTGFPASGTIIVETETGLNSVTYTGKTATSFTGCAGGGGKMVGGNYYYYRGGNVGYVNSQAGINHTTQGDPKLHGFAIRGCLNVHIDNCIFQQCYGDGIWIGQGATDFSIWSEFISISRTKIEMTARSGIAVAQKCAKIVVDRCMIVNTWGGGQQFDTEPVGIGDSVRDVTITRSYLLGWWGQRDAAINTNIAITVTGGYSPETSELDAARNYRIVGNVIRGSIDISNAVDVVVAENRILCDWNGNSYPPVVVQFFADDIRILDNYIYYRGNGTWGNAIVVTYQGYTQDGVVGNRHPRNVLIRGNQIHARNAVSGIGVDGQGGVDFNNVEASGVSGVTTNVVGTTVTDGGAAWSTNQWSGYYARVGTAYGVIGTNTATTFTVTLWSTPLGDAANTPTAGATYTILSGGDIVDIEGNSIDCTDDGQGQGGVGIVLTADRAGMRARVRNNKMKNVTAYGVQVDTRFRTTNHIEIVDNHVWSNNGATVAPTHALRFENGVSNITKLIVRGNTLEGSIAPLSGVTSGVWLVEDGEVQRWAGYGVPNGVIAARVGSHFHRRDDGAAAAEWVKQTGESLNTGWVRLTAPAQVQWTVDQGSGIATPINNTEWTNLIAAAGLGGIVAVPNALWLLQEAAGNPADSLGTFTLTASGTVSYQQVVSAWARKAVKLNDNVTGAFANTDAGLPDVSASPITMVVFADSSQGTYNASRSIFHVGTGASVNNIAYTGGGLATRVTSGANAATAAGTQAGTVRPYWIRHVPGSSSTVGGEDQNKLTPTFSAAVTGKRVALGALGGVINPPQVRALYAFAWFGNITDAQLKTILQQMGWQIQWT